MVLSRLRRLNSIFPERLVFINGHGGNHVPGQQAVFEARQRYRERDDLLLLFATYWLLGAEPHKQHSELKQTQMGHACEWETSMVLRIRPELVGDVKKLETVPFGNPFLPASRGWITKDRTAPGHIGEPEEDFPGFTFIHDVILRPMGLAPAAKPLPGDRATFYVPSSRDRDPRHGRRLMYMRDLACCAGGGSRRAFACWSCPGRSRSRRQRKRKGSTACSRKPAPSGASRAARCASP